MSRARHSPTTAIAGVLAALVMAVEVARLTVSSAVSHDNPKLALKLAPEAPWALTSASMLEVGQAAALGRKPPAETALRLGTVAALDPLRIEPFLVEGAMAERAGDYDRASRLLLQARERDPRSIAARYLYADTAVRQGKVVEALKEIAVLSRLLPGASVQLVPALAQYARSPGSSDQLKSILAQNPQLKNPLLTALATDPDNVELILALAGPPSANPTPDTRAWEAHLLLGLVARGEYGRARDLWRGFAALPPGPQPLLFNGSFRQVGAPPPFNWSFSASAAGIAEPGAHRLRVLYYGRQDAILVSQLLVLPPGRYRFEAPIKGDLVAGALSWTVSCVPAKRTLAEVRLSGSAQFSGTFTVPAAGCPAQSVQLNGHLQESPEDTDVRIGPAQIERLVQ